MLFNDDFLEQVSDNPVSSICDAISITFSDRYKLSRSISAREINDSLYNILVETYTLVLSIIESFDLEKVSKEVVFKDDRHEDSISLYNYLHNTKKRYNSKMTEMTIEQLKGKFSTSFGQSFTYEFSQGDLDKTQKLISELREEINASDLFEDKHKRRLLKRLEKLQSELHKKVSDLDCFWGLVGDAGVAIGKFGKDAKPIVDRIRDITEIVWNTQSRAEELPSNVPTPLLESLHTEEA